MMPSQEWLAAEEHRLQVFCVEQATEMLEAMPQLAEVFTVPTLGAVLFRAIVADLAGLTEAERTPVPFGPTRQPGEQLP